MSEDAATLTTEQAAARLVDIIEGRDGQLAIDMTLASDRDMAYNLNTIIEFRLRTLLGAYPPPSDVRNRHEAYGIAAENFCQVNASVKKIRSDISTGSACDGVNTEISHVLQAIQLEEDYARGTIRISLGKDNTEDDVEKIAAAFMKILA